jgi:hypothetical protein
MAEDRQQNDKEPERPDWIWVIFTLVAVMLILFVLWQR